MIKTMYEKNCFVLDPSTILHDSACVNEFGEDNDLVIPITTIEELDKFKTGTRTINQNARDFLNFLDSFQEASLFNGGQKFGEGQGKIRVPLIYGKIHNKITATFSKINSDLQILNVALRIKEDPKSRYKEVILITKSSNLRVRARALRVKAENYFNTSDEKIGECFAQDRVINNVPKDAFDLIEKKPFYLDSKHELLLKEDPFIPNEPVLLKNEEGRSALAFFCAETQCLKLLQNTNCYGINPRNEKQSYALSAMLNKNIQLVTISGKAGTGKTLLALAAAMQQKRLFRQILIARPTVPLSNKDQGFLPGDIKSKLDPYMQPLYDNLLVLEEEYRKCYMPPVKSIAVLLEEEKITVSPLSYIRGRNLTKVFFIIDEAQNLTPHEVKTIVTRAGEDTKIIFTGDIFQIDHPYLDAQTNGLTYCIQKMRGQKIYSHTNLEKGERSELAEIGSQVL